MCIKQRSNGAAEGFDLLAATVLLPASKGDHSPPSQQAHVQVGDVAQALSACMPGWIMYMHAKFTFTYRACIFDHLTLISATGMRHGRLLGGITDPISSLVSQTLSPLAFETKNGILYANGHRFHLKGATWCGHTLPDVFATCALLTTHTPCMLFTCSLHSLIAAKSGRTDYG